MTERLINTMVGFDTDRICAECHHEKLEFHELEFVEKFDHEEWGECLVYVCVDCGSIDVLIEENGKWARDYGHEYAELVG